MRQSLAVANSGPGPKPPPSEADALVRAYLEKRPNLVRFLAARTGSQAAAEDLAQDLYLKIAARPGGSEAENPTALLYRIALNLMLDRARGDRRAAVRDADWRAAHRTVVAGQDLADDAPADEAADSRQRLSALIDAAAALPPQMRRAFTLHKLEGLSHAETARAMGISVKSVEKHVSAALKALTARLAR